MRRSSGNWQKTALSEVIASAVDGPFGSNLKTEHYVSSPGVRVIRLQNIGTGSFVDRDRAYVSEAHARLLARHEVRAGDLLVASLGDENHPVARACSYPEDAGPAIVKADCFRLRPIPNRASSDYLALVLNSPSMRSGIAGYFQGVTRDRINLSALLSLRFPIPTIWEQQRIVEIIHAVDQRIRATDDVLKRSRVLRDGLLDQLILRGGPTTPISLGELASDVPGSSTIGPFGSNLVAQDYRNSGHPVVFVRDIRADGYHWISNVYVSESKARELRAHSVRAGDLLMTKMGVPPCISAVYPDDAPEGIITADVLRIRLNNSLADAQWVSHVINHESFARKVRGITGGVTRPKVTLRDVRSLIVDLPPLRDQLRNVELIDNLSRMIDAALSEQRRLALMRQGLTEDLLSGRVRV